MKIKRNGIIHGTLTGYDFTVDEPLTRTQSIRRNCLECMGGNAAEVRRCHITDCFLWPWRLGRSSRARLSRPKNDRLGTERPESDAE